MNPFDEQLQSVKDTAEAAENALKSKKLYTWYDMDLRDRAVKDLTKEICDIQCKDPWDWGSFFVGLGIGIIITIILSIIIHNN